MFGLAVFAFLIAYKVLFCGADFQQTVSQWAHALFLWHILSLVLIQSIILGILSLAFFGKARITKISPSEWFNNTVGSVGFILGSLALTKYFSLGQNPKFLWVATIMYLTKRSQKTT
jgi:nucleoside permease NupC